MAVVLITYAPTREAFEQIEREVGSTPPPGCIVHTASELEGRVRIVDVWESKQHIDDFFHTKLGPAFAKFGVEPEQPELTETFRIEHG